MSSTVESQLISHLLKAVTDLAVFFEFADPTILDEAVSVKMMEQLASELGLMGIEAQRVLAEQLRKLATSYSDAEQKTFVEQLPNALGLES